ncbi:MAG: PD-(D/E)XK nuclease family protein, partial [Chloroflexi bacterium]|nr:PD-(D/E)XK nuclease family protein [Chloroflexota bacterium]
ALTDNFRSTHAIVEIADSAVREIPFDHRLAKSMVARQWSDDASDFVETLADPGDIRVRSFPSEADEAEWVARRIEELRGAVIGDSAGKSRAIDYADMAILLRSVRSSGKVISDTLQSRGIPVVVKGVGGLFDHPEVALIQASFCLLSRSDLLINESGAFKRMHEPEIREFIRRKIAYLRDVTEGMPAADEARYLAWIAAKREELDRRSLERSRRGRLARRVYPQDIFQEMLRELGSTYGPDPWPSAVLYNLGRLSSLITDFESVHQWVSPQNLQSLCLFLSGWAASKVDEGGLDEGISPNAVQIMTIHAAKGLEWPVVFVPRVSSANFPSSLRNRGVSTFLAEDLFDGKQYASGDEGERRLWYVALTRCRRFLNVSSPDRANKRPTRYFKDIRHDIVVRDELDIALEKDDPVPPANTELLPTTYTELNYYWRCPFEYQLRALMGFGPGVRESYGYGQQIHNILAEMHQSALDGEPLTREEVSDLVEARFHLRYTRDGEIYKPFSRLRDAAKLSILRYLDSYPKTTQFVLDAEKPFEFVDRATGALISGTVDLIQRVRVEQSGLQVRTPVAIVDFKAHRWSGMDEFKTRRDEVATQLRLYAVAVGQAWGFETQAAYAHFLSPRPPPEDLVAQGVEERATIDVSNLAQNRVRLKVAHAVQEIQGSIENGVFGLGGVQNGSCRDCDFRGICPGFRQWESLDKTTPRRGSLESERLREIDLIGQDVYAG